MKNFLRLLFSTALLFIVISVVSASFQVPIEKIVEVVLFATLLLVVVRFFALVKHRGKVSHSRLAFGVAVEFWDNYIATNLYKTYEWISRAKDRSASVLNSAVVHIPQAGARPNAQRNRTQFPIGKINRADSDITYAIDEISTDTDVVKEAEKWELSYSKVSDVLLNHMKTCMKLIAQNSVYRWLGKNTGMLNLNSANIVRTTGANTGHLLSGATGTRNLLTVADLTSARTIIVSQTKLINNPGRRAFIMSEESYQDLLADTVLASLLNHPKIGAIFKDGDLIGLLGFDIVRTDVMCRFDNSGTPLAKDPLDPAVVNAVTDNDVTLAVDFDFIHIAKSDTKLFFQADNPDYQGDIMNVQARCGASRERVDQAGVAAIVQQ